jgi:hypothetical protein
MSTVIKVETGGSAESAGDDETTEITAESDTASEPIVSDEVRIARRRRTRIVRGFPASSFLEALPLAEAIHRIAAGQKIRRLTLFEQIGRSAESGTSRQLVTNSNQYGLTKGSYTSEYLELTDVGKLASGDASLGRARLAARLDLAIAKVVPFNTLYEQFKNNRLPAASVMRDFVIEQALTSEDTADECVETFLANARDLKLLTNYAGAERLLTFEILLDELASAGGPSPAGQVLGAPIEEPIDGRILLTRAVGTGTSPAQVVAESSDLSNVCFLVTPIGGDGSEQRQHADLMLGSLIEPALAILGMRLVRADKISTPGLITSQVIDHLVRAPLVIADLSFGNPNVFYELALRHASRKPTVQVIRTGDPLPFDVGQFRTVTIDTTSIYTLVPQIDTYRAEIARQCRSAMDERNEAETPLSRFYPTFWNQFSVLPSS